MTTDHIDRAAEVLDVHTYATSNEGSGEGPRVCRCGHREKPQDGEPLQDVHRRHLLVTLDAAGLLTKYPRLEVEGDWLIEVVDYHTCGAGPGSGAGHEPGCGSMPVGRLATPENDAEVAAKAWDEGFSRGFHEGASGRWTPASDASEPSIDNPYERGVQP